MALDRDLQVDPLPTTRTQDCRRASSSPMRVGARQTAHIKQGHRACSACRCSAAPALVSTLACCCSSCGSPTRDLTPMQKRVIALDVHQARITVCAVVEHDDARVEVNKRDRRALAQERLNIACPSSAPAGFRRDWRGATVHRNFNISIATRFRPRPKNMCWRLIRWKCGIPAKTCATQRNHRCACACAGCQVSGFNDLMYFAMAAISSSLSALLKLGIRPDLPFLIRSKTFFSLSVVPASCGPLSAFIP